MARVRGAELLDDLRLVTRDADAWATALDAVGVPAGKARDLGSALSLDRLDVACVLATGTGAGIGADPWRAGAVRLEGTRARSYING